MLGSRIDSAGTTLDSFPIVDVGGWQHGPAVAFNGSYLVAWVDGRRMSSESADLYAARVTTGGAVQDPDGFFVDEGHDVEASAAPKGGWALATRRGFLGDSMSWYGVSSSK